MLLFFTVMMCLYILIEFAVNCYFFTWMNHNIFVSSEQILVSQTIVAGIAAIFTF